MRKVKKIVSGSKAVDGAGVKLVRVLGKADVLDFDPFLMMDAFDSDNYEDYIKGFPWHPHRGIETITYLIEGEIEHMDSLGNKGLIKGGDCQWMTAGSGILHQEMPLKSPKLLGTQLWLNIPSKNKMSSPKYGDIKKDDIPLIKESGADIRIIAGSYKDLKGAFNGQYVDANYFDISIAANTEWHYKSNLEHTLFVYIVHGSASFAKSDRQIPYKNVALFDKGEDLYIKSGDNDLRLLLFSAKPLSEPIAWGGPIVMNTDDELRNAFKELDDGTFIKESAN